MPELRVKPDRLPTIFRAIRIKSGKTQAQLGRLLGCHSITISRYETGERKIPLEVLEKMGEIFGFEMCFLFYKTSLQPAQSDPADGTDDPSTKG